ncbi:hypothetical protein CDD83_8177 [Cordyceps sp. RAO-2017]|nr:hypothetical protein CDD83_8177 [Cordyceps sp. RAO-2017]
MDMAAADETPAEPSVYVVCAIPIAILAHAVVFRRASSPASLWTMALPSLVAGACFLWLNAVSRAVPEPYLDEVFHIPQAQRYCHGDFRQWDAMITTPPGLYLVSNLVPHLFRIIGLRWDQACDARSLRAANAVGLLVLALLFLLCRRQMEGRGRPFSEYAIHGACNVALFPLLFFFSGLYYTDVISTAAVLGALLNHLHRLGRRHRPGSLSSDLATVALGLLALFMRQTNVFWVVVYMGGLEAVDAIKTLAPARPEKEPAATATSRERLKHFAQRWSVGDIHDLPLDQAWPDDAILTAVSLAVAAACNPGRVLRRVWPYVAVLGAFVAFVAWNGGVVLGDKSNHVATIHLAQMLYIWPLFAFFSLPLLLPGGLALCDSLRRVWTQPWSAAAPPSWRSSVAVVFHVGTALLSCAVVRYNTIIHPFTLADNRHYMFYVFRHSIRRAGWVRYLLVVPYSLSRWLVWATLAGRDRAGSRRAAGTQRPASTSTGLVFLLATSLSLVTAPLVEPRYFILPWVVWRLLVPAWGPGEARDGGRLAGSARLLAETAWFVAINLATGYVFLGKPYVWTDADGHVLDGGRLQRFMW